MKPYDTIYHFSWYHMASYGHTCQLKNELIRNHLSATAIISKVLPNNLTAVDDRQQLVFVSKTQTMVLGTPKSIHEYSSITNLSIILLKWPVEKIPFSDFSDTLWLRFTLPPKPAQRPEGPKALSCFASLVVSRWVPTDLWASEAGVIYPTKVEHMSMIYPNPGESQIVTWVKLYDKQLIYAGYTPDIPWPLTGWDVLPSSWTRDGNWWCHLKVGISSSFFGNFLGISWMLSEVGEAIFPIKKMVFGRKP